MHYDFDSRFLTEEFNSMWFVLSQKEVIKFERNATVSSNSDLEDILDGSFMQLIHPKHIFDKNNSRFTWSGYIWT